MKGVILYQSKYGAAKRYADWLADETGFACIETKKANLYDAEQADLIILGGGIYASGIAGLSFLKKHIDVLKDKKIIVFCVGASPYDEKAMEEIVKHNMNEKLADIPCFYCRGAWDADAMNLIDRSLCKMLIKAVSKKKPEDYELWEKALMEAGENKCDWTDKKYIEPILKAVNK